MVISRDIDRTQWHDLVKKSSTSSWFQTPEAWDFYQSVADELTPFAYGVVSDETKELKGVCVGYIVPAVNSKHSIRNSLYRYFTSRAIISGGPMLADDITDDQLCELLSTLNSQLSTPIYIETRNFNDYSRWKHIFEQCGFAYQPHYDVIQPTATIDQDMLYDRRRNIRRSEKRCMQARLITPDDPKFERYFTQFYSLLSILYRKHLHLPLFSQHFFEQLVKQKDAHFFAAILWDDVVGGELCVTLNGSILYSWYGCRNRDVFRAHPEVLATYKAIIWARDNGVPKFDFMGAGSPDQPYGVRDFKMRFGGQLVEYGRFLHVNAPLRYNFGKTVVKILHSIK